MGHDIWLQKRKLRSKECHLRGTDPDAMEAAVYAYSVIAVREMCRLFNINYMTIHREMRRAVKV